MVGIGIPNSNQVPPPYSAWNLCAFQAKLMFASGWASVAATYRDLERTETAEKLKEGTVTMIDKSMDGLSKVRYSSSAAMAPRKHNKRYSSSPYQVSYPGAGGLDS